jgi:hypothetical protein
MSITTPSIYLFDISVVIFSLTLPLKALRHRRQCAELQFGTRPERGAPARTERELATGKLQMRRGASSISPVQPW